MQSANCRGRQGLSTDELAVLEALWGGKTQVEAAVMVGVSRRTVQYWVKRPAFRAEWEARQAARWREFQESLRARAKPEPHPMAERLTGLGWKASQRVHAAQTIVSDTLRRLRREQEKERRRVLREMRAEARHGR